MSSYSTPEIEELLKTLSVVELAEEIVILRCLVRALVPFVQHAVLRKSLQLSDQTRALARKALEEACRLGLVRS